MWGWEDYFLLHPIKVFTLKLVLSTCKAIDYEICSTDTI